MATTIDQKAYLQKYIGGPSGDRKKKKKKVLKGKGFQIIDDDLDLTKLRPLDGDELDIFDEGEDAPQIAGIIDERPEEVKKLEQFKTTSKWKVVNQDDGFNSKLQIQEIKKDIKEMEKENELIFGKMYSDSEDEKKNDSDLSPPRKNSKENKEKLGKKPQNLQNHRDSDFSPRRKRDRSSQKNKKSDNNQYDSDVSPPRKSEISKTKERTRKPSRWEEIDSSTDKKSRNRSPSCDLSPSRNKEKISNSLNKRNKSSKRSSSSDISPPRKSQKNSQMKKHNSDLSPPRKSKMESPNKKRNRSPDSDVSPPRRRKQSPERQNTSDYHKGKYRDQDKDRNNYRYMDKHRKRLPEDKIHNIYKKQRHSSKSPERYNKRKHHSESDTSPRKNQSSKRTQDAGRSYRNAEDEDRNSKRNNDSPPPSNKKMARTLEGKKAGLQDANQLRQENELFRRKEEEAFSKMTDEVSGKNAQVVSRKGKRETSEDRQKQKEKAERQKELDEKYKKWSKGVKQIEEQEARIQEYMHEAAKPLARHKGDRDLEERLKQVEREGDPMLKYIREKKIERGEMGPEKPIYKGNFPPNRFNIRPGYRWDGVDRSNGYEKKYFEQQSKKRAQEEEAYKWSTEDL